MLEFKSVEDLAKLPRTDPAYPIIEDLVKRLITDYIAEGWDYRPEDDGWIILIEEDDVDRELTELWDGCRLTNIYWEGFTKQSDCCYLGVVLFDDQAGHCFVIPNAPWVNGELREVIEQNLDP